MVKVSEEKEAVPSSPPLSTVADLPLSLGQLRTSLMRGSKSYRTTIGLAGALTTSGTGAINSTILCSSLAAVAEFVSFATLFDEFYIHSFRADYEPFNQNMTNPSSSLPSGLYAGGLILGVPLYHGATSYASATLMASNTSVQVMNTGRPWSMTWRNNETPKSKVTVASSTSTATPCQSWCLTAATPAAAYTGSLQFRSNTNFANVLSTTLGDVLIRYDVSFRARA